MGNGRVIAFFILFTGIQPLLRSLLTLRATPEFPSRRSELKKNTLKMTRMLDPGNSMERFIKKTTYFRSLYQFCYKRNSEFVCKNARLGKVRLG